MAMKVRLCSYLIPEWQVGEGWQTSTPPDGHEEEAGRALIDCLLARWIDGALWVCGNQSLRHRAAFGVVIDARDVNWLIVPCYRKFTSIKHYR